MNTLTAEQKVTATTTVYGRPRNLADFQHNIAAWDKLRAVPADRQAILDWVELGERAHDELRRPA